MSGDLGNLLTGEMGEAEARFAHEDFAEACGRRVAQRVRRRRTVRAVGAGGGSMLTAGALAVGASNVPWGAWGVAGVAPGSNLDVGSDCFTPSPSASTVYSEGTIVHATLDADGNIIYTDADGTVLNGLPDGEGRLVFGPGAGHPLTVDEVTVSSGAGLVEGETRVAVGTVGQLEDAGGEEVASTFRYSVDAVSDANADDCYTPSPTPSAQAIASASASPSPDPTLAAKPEDVLVDSPFECGFEFPAENSGSDELSIAGTAWMSPEEVVAAFEGWFGADAFDGATIPTVEVASATIVAIGPAASEATALSIVYGAGEPTVDETSGVLLSEPTEIAMSAGMTFVAVSGGAVVATGTEPDEGHSVADPIAMGPSSAAQGATSLYLMDAAKALTSCDATAVDLAQVDFYVVAATVTRHYDGTIDGPTYAWAPVGKP